VKRRLSDAGSYNRLSKADKLRRTDLFDPRPMYRCARCKTRVEDRDRAGHLERCWPEVLMERFTKLT
jgi:hypothetical protein